MTLFCNKSYKLPVDRIQMVERYPEWVKFIRYGEEHTKEGKWHLQCWLQTWTPVRHSQFKAWVGDSYRAPMHGTLTQNDEYCSKEGKYKDLGDRPAQGRRTDLLNVKRRIDSLPEGSRTLDLAEEEQNFGHFARHSRFFKEYHEHVRHKRMLKEGFKPKQVFILQGKTCQGKTRSVTDEHGFDNVWECPVGERIGRWYDGYIGQPVALFNECTPGTIMSISDFLRITDGYPVTVPIKGGFTSWRPEAVYFTSNVEWEKWWPTATYDQLQAAKRRITELRVFKEDGTVEFY